jgi:hypothetical protein
MPDLRTMQKALHDFLRGQSCDIESYVVGKNTAEVKRRLAVYQEAYQLRLEENLKKQYPVLALWLGAEAFTQLALAYEKMFPPTDCAMRHYAAHLAEYFRAVNDVFLFDLATFEWAMNVALDDSADAILLTLADFQKITPDVLLSLRFQFNPSLQLLSLQYNIPVFWQTAQKAKPRVIAEYCPDQRCVVCVWRRETLPYFRCITPLEETLINAAMHNQKFSDLCDLAAASLGEQAIDVVAQTILRWLKDGWLRVQA